ncbi:hypothetical protein FBEOM_13825 [Fusarium beomiforme]|uniref:Ubiquitin-like protease family profile domain-containing protein n=1 Tax=Fusarium beomiforme TaxID=44412 RepID=A0A9P5A686_9HYPO|nr:hypothetical protein FBEOM_13825 [Fusarium beomiforme]
MKSRIRAINDQRPRSSMGGGQPAEMRSYYGEFRDDRSNKRVKQFDSELPKGNGGRYLPTSSSHQPLEAIDDEEPQTSRHKYHDLTREDSIVETIDSSSIISFGRNAGAASNQQEYRNIHRQNSVKHSRRRRKTERKISSSPIEIDDTSAVAHRNLAPQPRVHTSPDHLAIEVEDDPPPADITSNIVSQPKRPATEYPQSMPKRFKVCPQSDDELAPGAPAGREAAKKPGLSKLLSQRGDIHSTAFKTAKLILGREPSVYNGPALKDVSLEAAICGRLSFSPADNIGQVKLRLGRNTAEPIHEHSQGLSWLKIFRSAVRGAKHNNTNSPVVLVNRSAKAPISTGRLVLKFADNTDTSYFIRWLHGLPGLVQHDLDKLNATFYRSKKEADDCRGDTVKPSDVYLQDDSHEANTAKLQLRSSHRDPFLGSSLSSSPPITEHRRLKDGMQSVSRPREDVQTKTIDTEDLYTGLARSPWTETRRSTRLQSPPTPREKNPEPWTARNPGWEKKWHRSLVWPPTGKNRATVDKDDIQRLDEGEFLNDNLISFYLRYLQDQLEKKQPEILNKVYIFSTFFFEKLRSNRAKINYEGVKAWTARIELLSYEYIVVPVNENAHWYLAIIYNAPRLLQQEVKAATDTDKQPPNPRDAIIVEDNDPVASPAEKSTFDRNPSILAIDVEVARSTRSRAINGGSFSLLGDENTANVGVSAKTSKRKSAGRNQKFSTDDPRIITLDSLGSAHPPTCKCLKDYLIEEAKHKKGLEISGVPGGMTARGIPMQDNFCDCGVYVLGYMENFLRDPDEAVRRLLHKEDTGWEINAPEIRAKVRDLLFECQEKQHERLEKEKEMKRQRRGTKGPVSSPQVAVSSPQVPQTKSETPQNLMSLSVNGAKGSPTEAARQIGTTSSYFAVSSAEKPAQPQTPARNNESSLVQPLREDSSNESKASSSRDVYHSARSSPINSAPPVPCGLTTEGLRDEWTPKHPSTPTFIERLSDSPDDVGPTTTSTIRKTSSPSVALVTRHRSLPGSQGNQRVVEPERFVVKSIEDDQSPPRGPQYDGVDQSIDLTVS